MADHLRKYCRKYHILSVHPFFLMTRANTVYQCMLPWKSTRIYISEMVEATLP
jgi:hypothetical protein